MELGKLFDKMLVKSWLCCLDLREWLVHKSSFLTKQQLSLAFSAWSRISFGHVSSELTDFNES